MRIDRAPKNVVASDASDANRDARFFSVDEFAAEAIDTNPPGARGEGSGSESEEQAVVVEVSFTSDAFVSDAHVFTDDKE